MTPVAVLFCFPVQNLTEIGQLAFELRQKMIFKMATVRRLEFLKCSYYVIWVSSSKCAVVYQILSKSDDFYRAMLCIRAAYAAVRCLSVRSSVRPSVTFVYSVDTNKISLTFCTTG